MMLPSDIIVALTVLTGCAMLALAALRGWEGWLAFKRCELDRHEHSREMGSGSAVGAARIEIADLKERIRKLEAIASGVDL